MQPSARTDDTVSIKDAATREMPPLPAIDPAPLTTILRAPKGEGCPSCGSQMTADQRYCVECGERRGEPRLPFMDGRTAVATQTSTPASPPPPPPGYAPHEQSAQQRRSAGFALASTIALLLLAMGVGVMIGNDGSDGKSLASQPVVVGGAVAGTTTATGATDSAGDTADAKAASSDAAPEEKAGVNADEVAKKNGVKLAPKDVSVGDKCEPGSVGCEGGEFTGDYFGE